MKKALIIIAVILVIIVWKGVSTYNNIIALEEGVKTQWAQVENTYQRRFDLIPNLVNTVQGEANFEKSTLTEVIDMRSRMGGTVKLDESLMNDEAALKRFQEVQGNLSGALQRLMAVSENYPDLKPFSVNWMFLSFSSTEKSLLRTSCLEISFAFAYFSVASSAGPLMISGVRASSIKMESTSSTIQKLSSRCTNWFGSTA